ncbi:MULTISPECIES: DUF4345 domain-containing protein [unclassified Sphingosinithalassobacter]|uniref:DUF4345 domain-containing protein n=1 Tax=unclassified Sphingosinithalassobacter TaxID=2676235 RepID=UPI00165DF58A|nr:DUF4345 domain-containing protein [Sphingosinithalassobacter sp. CS137]
MSPSAERHLLQAAVALTVLVPIFAAGTGILLGAQWLGADPARVDLDSHFRYLSGIFLMLGLGFASCIPRIETMGPRFRLLGAMVVAGGLARALSLVDLGPPSAAHLAGLGIELGVVPLLLLWQARVARRYRAMPSSPGPASTLGT